MTTSNLQNIYSDFRSDFQDNPDFVIDFYSRHSLFFNNIRTLSDEEDLRLFIEITWQYVNATYKKSRFNDTIDNADKALRFIDNEINRLNAADVKDRWYRGIMLFKGISSYELRDYKTSTKIFKELVKVDGKNDNYKNWLNYSSYGERLWLVRIINIICGLMCATEILLRSYIPNAFARVSILGLGVFGLVANWGYEHYVRRNFRKTKET